MAAPANELGWVVHFAPVVRFTPLSPIYDLYISDFLYRDLRSCHFHDPPIVSQYVVKNLSTSNTHQLYPAHSES